jgi:hypothetical protein
MQKISSTTYPLVLTAKRRDSADLSDQQADSQVGPTSAVDDVEYNSLGWWMWSESPYNDCRCEKCHDVDDHGDVRDHR